MTANFNTFKVTFRQHILGDTATAALIGTRFYGAQLATVFDPIFPNAVFFQDPGNLPIATIVWDFVLNVRAYSSLHFDEAYGVFNAIMARLDSTIIGHSIVVRPITTPVEHFIEVSRLYGIYGKFKIIWLP